jgi:hypothetical protein
MQHRRLALTVSVLALTGLAFSSPAFAARQVAYSKQVTAIGNNVTIKISGGNPPVVQKSNSCSPGVTGYLYQSIVIIFGGGSITTTQSTYCP